MSMETRTRGAVDQARRGLAAVIVPHPDTIVRRSRRRRRAHVSIALATAVVVVGALVVPFVVTADRSATPSVVGAPGETLPPRAGKAFVIGIEPEAIAAADEVGVNLTRLTRRSLARIGQLLPDLERVVRVEVGPARAISELGVGSGTDPTSGEVFLSLDPRLINRERLRTWVPALLAQAAYASVRVRHGLGPATTLGDWMVSVGLGSAFAREAFPATPLLPWAQALTDEQRSLVWASAQPLLSEALPDREAATERFGEWFYGGGGVPRWAGTTLGFELVDAYLTEHPEVTAATLVAEPAEAIITESDYDPPPPDPNRPRCYYTLTQTHEVVCGDFEPSFDARGVVAEPGRCYLVGPGSVSERACRDDSLR